VSLIQRFQFDEAALIKLTFNGVCFSSSAGYC